MNSKFLGVGFMALFAPVLTACAVEFDEAILNGDFGVLVEDFVPSFDSKLEFDFSFNSLSGNQGIFANARLSDAERFRLLFLGSSGWEFDYGTKAYTNSKFPMPNTRYTLVVNGPVVTLNGEELFNVGEKLTDSGARILSLFSTQDDAGIPDNMAKVTMHSVKVWNAKGDLELELRPGVLANGQRALLADKQGLRGYQGKRRNDTDQVRSAFAIHPLEKDLVADGATPNVTLGENTTKYSGTLANLFSSTPTTVNRLLLKEPATTVCFDIPAEYESGKPIFLTRFVIVPCVSDTEGNLYLTLQRCPAQFELQASIDGETWVTLYEQAAKLSPEYYHQGEAIKFGNAYGYMGVSFEIPEANRGDYRHYRLVTKATYRGEDDTNARWGVQALKIFGVVGGVEPRCAPIEFVQNGLSDQGSELKSDGTRFLTGVQPNKADMEVELKGMFTSTAENMGLICCRGKSSANPWGCFLISGKLRLYYESVAKSTSFEPQVNTPYTITLKGNKLFVDGTKIYEASATNFKPGSEIVLLSTHNGLAEWDNQARFKLTSCRILDSFGGVVRDYIPTCRTTDNVNGLFDRVSSTFLVPDGPSARGGAVIDADFRQNGRAVTLATEPVDGHLPQGPLTFAFEGNQFLSGTLCAAFDDGFAGADISAWKNVVELGSVTNGVKTMTIGRVKNPTRSPCVKFFVRDDFAGGVSQTRSYAVDLCGLSILVR